MARKSDVQGPAAACRSADAPGGKESRRTIQQALEKAELLIARVPRGDVHRPAEAGAGEFRDHRGSRDPPAPCVATTRALSAARCVRKSRLALNRDGEAPRIAEGERTQTNPPAAARDDGYQRPPRISITFWTS